MGSSRAASSDASSWYTSPTTEARPRRHLVGAEACAAVAACPGLLPVEVTGPPEPRIVWLDFGERPLVESKFRVSVALRVAEEPSAACFTTPFDLEILAAAGPPLPLAGLVFLLPHSGTTLLTKALAQDPSTAVITEATALQEGVLSALTEGWTRPLEPERAARALGGLLRALTRRRRREEQRAIVKLMTFHTLYLDPLRAAVPEAPFLFCYREPREVLRSALRKPGAQLQRVKGGPAAAAWTGLSAEETAAMEGNAYRTRLYQRYLEALLAHAGPVHLLRYRDLRAETLGALVARVFGMVPEPAVLVRMGLEFGFYSKSDGRREGFAEVMAQRSAEVPPACAAAAEQVLDPLVARLEAQAEAGQHRGTVAPWPRSLGGARAGRAG